MSVRRTQPGFSLIEVLVAVAIIALLTVFGMPMYTTWMQNSQLRASAESVAAGLQHARSEAVRANLATGVRFELTGGNAWRVQQVSDNSVLQQGGGLDLAKNAVVTPNPNTTEVVFTPLGQTNPAVTLNIDVTHANSSLKCRADGGDIRCLRVQVRSGGLVRLCDPSVTAAGDPRTCLP